MAKSTIRHHLWSLVFIVGFAVALQVLEYFGVFAIVEGKVADFYLNDVAPSDETHRVVTIGINDKEYEEWFNGTSPLDPVAITGLVASVFALGPTVVGVDVLTDWSQELTEKADRSGNLQRIAAAGTPVVWASSGKGEVRAPGFWAWLFGAHETMAIKPGHVLGRPIDEQQTLIWGVPMFPLDHDRSARRFPRTWSDIDKDHSEFHNTFAREIATQHCRGPRSGCQELGLAHEVFIAYEKTTVQQASGEHSPSPSPDFSVGDLFTCQKPPQGRICTGWMEKATFKLPPNVAVLLGGTFAASRDFYPTPAGANTPGMLINARAVEAEFRGPRVLAASHILSVGLDILIGCLVGVIFFPSQSQLQSAFARIKMRRLVSTSRRGLVLRVAATFGLGLLALPLSYFLFTTGVLWVSWVGMLLTILSLHVIVELLGHDEPHVDGSASAADKILIHQEKTPVSEKTTVSIG